MAGCARGSRRAFARPRTRLGWLDRRTFEKTGDEVRSQGWTPFVLDANGNGRRDEHVEPNPKAGWRVRGLWTTYSTRTLAR